MSDVESIRFECPNCDKRLRVAAKAAGKRVHCPTCAKMITVPDESDVGEEQSEPTGQRLLWPWFAGGGAAAVLLVGLVIWLAAGRKKEPELAGPPNVAAGANKPANPVEPRPAITKEVPEPKPSEPNPKPKDPPKPKLPEVGKENTLYFDKDRGIARFTPKITGKLESGEEFALFVFMAPKDGRPLDDEIAAGHFRGDIAFRYSPLTKSSFSSGTIVGGGKVLGHMNVFYRVGAEGKAIEFGLSHQDAGGKVSAAIGVKKTVRGNFEFVRFVTPVSVLETASK